MKTRHSRRRSAFVLCIAGLAAFLLGGCATRYGVQPTSDPLEPVNRPVSVFNTKFDQYLLGPTAHVYVEATPQAARTGVTNFFSNLATPNTIVNDFFQAKLVQGVSDTGRLVVNSTLGVGGLFDVASMLGLEKHKEDFGQTLGVWGSGPGPYLVIPANGPSDVRDAPGLAMAAVTNPLFYVPYLYVTIPLAVLGAVNLRANLEGAVQFRKQAAIDNYIFTRESYQQHRRFVIYDGRPPLPPLPPAAPEGGKPPPPQNSGAPSE